MSGILLGEEVYEWDGVGFGDARDGEEGVGVEELAVFGDGEAVPGGRGSGIVGESEFGAGGDFDGGAVDLVVGGEDVELEGVGEFRGESDDFGGG